MGVNILGLFPYFGPDAHGGVQLSGRLAWEGIRANLDESSGSQAHLFSYGAPPVPRTIGDGNHTTYAMSRRDAIVKASRQRWSPDLVLVWHLDLLRLLPLFRARQAQVGLFIHGIEAWRPLGLFSSMMLRRVNLILTNSDHTWNRLLAWHPHLAGIPHRTVPLGLDAPLAAPPPLPDAPPTVLMLSRLAQNEDYKGHREIIACWPLVQRALPEARLWIAGDGDLRPELERQAEQLGVGGTVRFWGRVTEAQKESLLLQCHCFAMPSQAEGFGLVYLEAMRLGRPCLVSDADAGREVVNPPEAGLAVNPQDGKALAQALIQLLARDQASWQAWSDHAMARYAQHYTATHFQSRLAAALLDANPEVRRVGSPSV